MTQGLNWTDYHLFRLIGRKIAMGGCSTDPRNWYHRLPRAIKYLFKRQRR